MASDAEGRVISHIQSVSGAFGSGILEQGTGVIAHNRGSAFTLHPGAPSELTGSTKPPHTLMPALARRQGRIVAAAGTMGGKNQPMIVAQVMSRLLEGASPQEAVDAPRWVVPAVEGSEEPVILVEEAMDAAAREYLDAAGIPVEQIDGVDNRLGHAQAILIGEGSAQVGSDRRADGTV
jgi:gamma-glutamyltranspeptidase/glutathione hydrolase